LPPLAWAGSDEKQAGNAIARLALLCTHGTGTLWHSGLQARASWCGQRTWVTCAL
jgi:hypothetical protein